MLSTHVSQANVTFSLVGGVLQDTPDTDEIPQNATIVSEQQRVSVSDFMPRCHPQIYPDPELEQQILALPIRCIHSEEGCRWTGQMKQLQVRRSSCFSLSLHHSLARSGAQHMGQICWMCGWFLLRPQGHFSTCAFNVIPCPNRCSVKLTRRDLPDHLQHDCPKRKVKCEFCGSEFTGEAYEVNAAILVFCLCLFFFVVVWVWWKKKHLERDDSWRQMKEVPVKNSWKNSGLCVTMLGKYFLVARMMEEETTFSCFFLSKWMECLLLLTNTSVGPDSLLFTLSLCTHFLEPLPFISNKQHKKTVRNVIWRLLSFWSIYPLSFLCFCHCDLPSFLLCLGLFSFPFFPSFFLSPVLWIPSYKCKCLT